MKYTTNYNLKKPELTDYVNVEDLNENADIIDQKLKENENALAAHQAEDTQQAHFAKNIGLEDTDGNFTATDLEGAMQELFTFADNGKKVIASVVGFPATKENTFDELANHLQNGKKAVSDSLNSKGANTSANDSFIDLANAINGLSNIPTAGTGNIKSFYSGYHYSYDDRLIKKFNNAGVLLAAYNATKVPGGITDYGYGVQVSGDRYWDGNSYQTPGDLYLYHLNGSLKKYIKQFTKFDSWEHKNIYIIGDVWFATNMSGGALYDIKYFNLNGTQLGTIPSYVYIDFYNGEKNDLIVRQFRDASDKQSYYNVTNYAMRALTTEEQKRKNELKQTVRLLNYIY